MEDQSERRKRLKALRDEASTAVDTECGPGTSQALANPLTAPELSHSQQQTSSFSFYSDPLGSLQGRPPASRRPADRHSVHAPQAAQQSGMTGLTEQQDPGSTHSMHVFHDPQHQQPIGTGPPSRPTAFGMPHQSAAPLQPPAFNHQANRGRGYAQAQPWQAAPAQQGRGFPAWPLVGKASQHAGPPWRGPPGLGPPGFSPFVPPGAGIPGTGRGQPGRPSGGRGLSGRGPPGRAHGREGNANARGRGGRQGGGRGRGSSHGDQDNIEAYVSPAMLQDPWAALMKQHLSHQAQQPASAHVPNPLDSINAGAGKSLCDSLEAVEQEAQALQAEGALSEEGVTDRPWH